MTSDEGSPSTLIEEPDVMRTLPLASEGRVTIGRSNEAELDLDDPLISRMHAVLHHGPELAIEDLGSANGTKLGGRVLSPHRRYALEPGQVIDLGSTMLMVQ